jgi:tetratricopeptide (TPR) repeat protein
MKKYSFPIVIVVLAAILGLFYNDYQDKKNAQAKLQNLRRPQAVSTQSEWLNSKAAMEDLRNQVRRNPNDLKAKNQLAMAYVQESRATGNHELYDGAALKLVAEVLTKEPQNFDALAVKGTVLLSQHRFEEALVIAKDFIKIYPDAAFGYGLLCDATVELGKYQEAVAAADRMNQIRPDLRSYSRIAYLREIFGDTEGAKQAMEMAVKAGKAGLEQTEWCRVQLGKLYEQSGDWTKAVSLYEQSLDFRENYPYALAGMARFEQSKGNYTEGVVLMEKANAQIIDHDLQGDLIGFYEKNGEKNKAEKLAKEVIKDLAAHQHDPKNVEEHQHNADKELAYAYLEMGNLELAFQHAFIEYNRRPDNIEANECLAWVLFKRGDVENAKKHIQIALRTNSKNPSLREKANVILSNR